MHRFYLRGVTRDLHADLDEAISVLDLADEGDYRAFLRIHACALLPLEDGLERGGVAGTFAPWRAHSRRSALMRDCAAAGIDLAFAELPAIAGASRQMGVLYVLEGSRLGGRLLEGRAKSQSGRNAFLRHGRGEPLWADFLSHLERLPTDAATQRDLAEGARLAFGIYGAAARHIIAGMQRGGSVAVQSAAS